MQNTTIVTRTRRTANRRNRNQRDLRANSRRLAVPLPWKGTRYVNVPNVVPRRMIVSLPYGETLNRGVASPIDTYQWNLNSIFDPNRTGVGHQPLGHDQWAALYNRYRVMAVRVRADVVNDTSSVPVRFTLAPVNGSTPPTGTSALELPMSQSHVIGTSQGISVRTFDFIVDLPFLNGKTFQQYLDSDVTNSVFGSSPTELMVLNIYAISLNGGNISYGISLRLDFVVELSDPVELADS